MEVLNFNCHCVYREHDKDVGTKNALVHYRPRLTHQPEDGRIPQRRNVGGSQYPLQHPSCSGDSAPWCTDQMDQPHCSLHENKIHQQIM